jgi:hypothetical protein
MYVIIQFQFLLGQKVYLEKKRKPSLQMKEKTHPLHFVEINNWKISWTEVPNISTLQFE